jgi:hypothetical protein
MIRIHQGVLNFKLLNESQKIPSLSLCHGVKNE